MDQAVCGLHLKPFYVSDLSPSLLQSADLPMRSSGMRCDKSPQHIISRPGLASLLSRELRKGAPHPLPG